MRAGEAARRAGVHVETLRYYECRGLLAEPARMPGGHRRYSLPARWNEAPADAHALAQRLAERGNDLTDAAIALVPHPNWVLLGVAGLLFLAAVVVTVVLRKLGHGAD